MGDTNVKSSANEKAGTSTAKTYTGGCHCGAVRFEAEIDLTQPVSRCNCTVCTKIAPTTAVVKPAAFRLVSGAERHSEYPGRGGNGVRFFCKRCGVHCFGRGHLEILGGDFVSINVNTLDGVDPSALKVIHFDGRHDNWMAGPRETAWPVNA